MKKIIYTIAICLFALSAFAGNPDRQGEAGANELLFNPWAKSAGLHSMTTSSAVGVEAMRINVAGIGRIEGTEFAVANTRLYEGSDLQFNAFGMARKMGDNGAFGVSLAIVDFGDILVTTTANPGGSGGTFSPSFFHMGLGYAHTYNDKISVGILVRTVVESATNVSAAGVALDAGVQYVSGENDEFRLGISLRNIGSSMSFGGDGLTTISVADDTGSSLTVEQRAASFEIPSMLNIGLSYDFELAENAKLRALTNFTSNAFSRDQIGVGAELFFLEDFAIRGGYKRDFGDVIGAGDNIYTGFSGGISADFSLSEEKATKVGIDYAYRTTNPFRGTHNFTLRFGF